MEVLTGIVIKIPEKFNLELEQHLLDLKKVGVKKTKADLISELAQRGLLREKTIKI